MSGLTYVEHLLQSMAGLPNDLNRHLLLVHKLDTDAESLRKTIAESHRTILNMCNKSDVVTSADQFREIAQQLVRLRHSEKQLWILSQEKIAVVEDAKRLLANFLVKSDNDAMRFRDVLPPEEINRVLEDESAPDRFCVLMSELLPKATRDSTFHYTVLNQQELIEHSTPQFANDATTFHTSNAKYDPSWPSETTAPPTGPSAATAGTQTAIPPASNNTTATVTTQREQLSAMAPPLAANPATTTQTLPPHPQQQSQAPATAAAAAVIAPLSTAAQTHNTKTIDTNTSSNNTIPPPSTTIPTNPPPDVHPPIPGQLPPMAAIPQSSIPYNNPTQPILPPQQPPQQQIAIPSSAADLTLDPTAGTTVSSIQQTFGADQHQFPVDLNQSETTPRGTTLNSTKNRRDGTTPSTAPSTLNVSSSTATAPQSGPPFSPSKLSLRRSAKQHADSTDPTSQYNGTNPTNGIPIGTTGAGYSQTVSQNVYVPAAAAAAAATTTAVTAPSQSTIPFPTTSADATATILPQYVGGAGTTAAVAAPHDMIDPATGSALRLWCKCRQHTGGEMIGCDHPNCPIEWWHLDCVGLKEPPEGGWICPDCRERERLQQQQQPTPRPGRGRRQQP